VRPEKREKRMKMEMEKKQILAVLMIIAAVLAAGGAMYLWLFYPAGPSNKSYVVAGRIAYSSSCWFLEANQPPALFLLINPPSSLMRAGLNVTIYGELVTRPAGACQEGVPLKVLGYSITGS
jgi:hypothetical protein